MVNCMVLNVTWLVSCHAMYGDSRKQTAWRQNCSCYVCSRGNGMAWWRANADGDQTTQRRNGGKGATTGSVNRGAVWRQTTNGRHGVAASQVTIGRACWAWRVGLMRRQRPEGHIPVLFSCWTVAALVGLWRLWFAHCRYWRFEHSGAGV